MMRVVACLLLVACHHAEPARPPAPVANTPPIDAAPAPVVVAPAPAPDAKIEAPDEDIDSKDILARDPATTPVLVKHVLIGWDGLSHVDPRAAGRDNAAAAKLAREILAKLQADPKQIDELVKSIGEDPGMLAGEPYEVATDTPFVPAFKNLSLRLKLDEAGIVRTNFGYHVILRVAPPPPDPLESAAILARPEGKGPVQIEYVLIGWKDTPQKTGDPRSDRTKADADKLAKSLLARAARGEKMLALAKEFSEEPGEKGKPVEIATDTSMVEPFKKLALRLKLGEVGLAKTKFGWLVMKRVPPPPPDSLASTAILARKPVTEKAKVKHILLGWTDRHAEDERGKKRTRRELEALVKDTLAKLRKGGDFDALMAELSEDPGSAANGTSYDVTPDAGLVKPFKDLSLRLEVGELGVIDTMFGIHIIKRVE